MIPIRLTLKNFMSYGDPAVVVPFEGLHVACLSGDNGNGKSAILDGITWALWGKTRASASRSVSDDDLIRLNTDETEVRFEFDLNGQQYRVVKKRRRGKTSGQDWQLAQLRADGTYAAVGGGGQRETAKQIVQLLSMEYETFINSAYLQQGRADEFTRQTPDSRKRILGEILGLDRYDRLEAKAKERNKRLKEAVDELERELRLLEAQIAQAPEYQRQLTEVQTVLAGALERAAAQEAVVAEWRKRRVKLETLAGQLQQAEGRYRRAQEDARQREVELCNQVVKLSRLQEIIDQRDAIDRDYQALQRALARREQLEPMIEAFNKANQNLQIAISAIDLAEQQKRADLRVAEMELKQAEDRQREIERVTDQIRAVQSKLNVAGDIASQLERATVKAQALQEEFAQLSATNKELGTTVSELDEVIALLARPLPVCPVCESDLSDQKHVRVLARQQEKRLAALARQKEVQNAGRARKQALTAAQQEVARLASALSDCQALQLRHADLSGQLAQLSETVPDTVAMKRRCAALRAELDRGEFAAPQRAHRIKLEREIEGLKLSRAEYEVAKQQIARLDGSPARYNDLNHALTAWESELDARRRLEGLVAERAREIEAQEAELAGLRAEFGQCQSVMRDASSAEAELKQCHEEVQRLRVREASLTDYIARCEVARADKMVRGEEHRKVAEESRMYQGLANAFGKKGLQAMIIENTIPELEEEANDLLARMTENAMQVRFVTTRAARSGSHEIETLDITVNDDAGQRPYELFSGGEAFRINFAIRIAMSRLLARRSGAKLQTLIMDEGFGSQDGKGREKLVEVIGAIKDDFEKILVITHVEELKDAFTQRIEVTKDAAGSHVHVL